MWRLILSELEYNKIRVALLLILFPTAYFLRLNYPIFIYMDLAIVYIFILTMSFLVAFKNKELRERTFNSLPIKRIDIAVSRLVTILLPICYYTIIMLISELWFSKKSPDLFFVAIVFSLSVIGISIYFLIRDISLRYIRERGISKDRMKTILVFSIVVLNILTILLVLLTKEGLKVPLAQIIDFFVAINPFKGDFAASRLIVTSIVLASLTLKTYNNGKFHME